MQAQEVEQAFEQHAAAVHAAVFRLTLNRTIADDATQEAFVRLLTNPPKDRSNVAAWLKRVAVNCAIDNLRRETRQRPLGDMEPVHSEQAPVAHDADLSDELVEALQRLSGDQRAAVLAVDRDGMSYADAADLLGVRLSKLKTDLFRGRRALCEMLKHSRLRGGVHA